MGEKSDQIERHILETRNELSENFSELENKVKSAVDWRAQFEERPGIMLGLAFGGGMLLSALLPKGRSSSLKKYDTHWSGESRWPSSSEAPGASFKPVTSSTIDETVSKASETWDHLKGALLGVATAKLGTFIEELVPGFQEEFRKAKARNTSDSSTSGSSASPGSTKTSWQKANAAGAD